RPLPVRHRVEAIVRGLAPHATRLRACAVLTEGDMHRSLILIGFATIAAAAAAMTAVPAAAEDTVKIGFAGPMTGPVSAFGHEIERGMDMAVEAINAKGGVRGRKLEVVIRDDEFDPVKTVT